MAQIIPPWNGRNTSPAHNQRIIACIGERSSGSPRHYVIATYLRYGDDAHLSYPLYVGDKSSEAIGTQYLIAWQPLEIEGPEWHLPSHPSPKFHQSNGRNI